METVQETCGGDGDATLAATRDVRGQRLTSGGCRDECAEHFMVQGTPATFHAAISQERPPGGRSGAARRAARWIPGEGGRSQVWFQQGPSRIRVCLAILSSPDRLWHKWEAGIADWDGGLIKT